MGGSRFDRVVAVLELVTGIGVAAYIAVLGATARPGGGALIALAVLFLALVVTMSWRSVRRARHAAAREAAELPRTEEPGQPERPPAPTLSPAHRAEVARIVGILADAGLFAPRVPDPADLEEGVADVADVAVPDGGGDDGEGDDGGGDDGGGDDGGGDDGGGDDGEGDGGHGRVTQGDVLAALEEAVYWRPDRVHPADHLDALARHASQVEQDAGTLRGQVRDLARLVGDALTVRLVDVDLTDDRSGERPVVRTRVRLTLGDDERTLFYDGTGKDLSTVLHVAVARALRAVTASPRLAWFPVDAGVWIAALRDPVTVEGLTAALGPAAPEAWEWVDEQEPTAAGERRRPGPAGRG